MRVSTVQMYGPPRKLEKAKGKTIVHQNHRYPVVVYVHYEVYLVVSVCVYACMSIIRCIWSYVRVCVREQ